jgi:hypothetical protein
VERLDGLLEEAPAPIRKHRDAVAAELPEVRQVRARIAEDLKRFGLESILPEDGIGDGQG